MSLESYKKSIEAQCEREEYSKPKQQEVATEYVYIEPPKTSFTSFGWLIFALVVIAILVVAAIKNPSSSETKSLIKDALVEKVNEKIGAEMMNEENDGFKKFGAFWGMTLAPHLLDYFTNINVSDYVIFSAFDCTAKDGEETKTIVSGIVVFGKVIPLKSDLNKDTLEFN